MNTESFWEAEEEQLAQEARERADIKQLHLSEDTIERTVELRVDRLDCSFMRGFLTQEQYDSSTREISAWAESMYKLIPKQDL